MTVIGSKIRIQLERFNMNAKVILIIFFAVPSLVCAQLAGDYAPSYYQLLNQGSVVGCSYLESRGGRYYSQGKQESYTGDCIERIIFGSQHLVLLRVGIEDGMRNGGLEEWHPSGSQKTLGSYENGQLQGVYEEWHPNGTIATRYNFVDDELDGSAETWTENGTPLTKGEYKDGNLDGYFEEWDANGVESTRGCYVAGALQPISACAMQGVYN